MVILSPCPPMCPGAVLFWYAILAVAAVPGKKTGATLGAGNFATEETRFMQQALETLPIHADEYITH
ncbi:MULTISPECIES: hypothetical protein [unclassified Duganella]|uniref:hypothetical protein n=1 Tax=unclassified Duganella TaxID=2636909 RepID=UPI0011C0E5A9|nr:MULTISPECIES: hypothetical protein [unclassified Duganella]